MQAVTIPPPPLPPHFVPGAVSLVKLQAPAADELGFARSLAVQVGRGMDADTVAGCRRISWKLFLEVAAVLRAAAPSWAGLLGVDPPHHHAPIPALPRPQEIGGTKCLVLQQDSSQGQISTVVLRGSTDQVGGQVLGEVLVLAAWCRGPASRARTDPPMHNAEPKWHQCLEWCDLHTVCAQALSPAPLPAARRCWTTLSARWTTA